MPRYKLTFWTDTVMPKGSVWHHCPIVPIDTAGLSPLPPCAMVGIDIDNDMLDSLHSRNPDRYASARDENGAALEAVRRVTAGAKAFTVGVPSLMAHERPDDVGKALRHVLQSADALCIDCSHTGDTSHAMAERARRNRRAIDASYARRPVCCLVNATIDGHLLPERLAEDVMDAVWEAKPHRVIVRAGIEPLLDVACRESSPDVPNHHEVLDARRTLLATYGAVPERWTRRQAKAAVMETLGPWMDRLRSGLLSMSNPKETAK